MVELDPHSAILDYLSHVIVTSSFEAIARLGYPTKQRIISTEQGMLVQKEIPITWFAHGLRVVDIANPHAPREVASFMPDVPAGAKRVQSNDVCFDDHGLIYLIDRTRGLHILSKREATLAKTSVARHLEEIRNESRNS